MKKSAVMHEWKMERSERNKVNSMLAFAVPSDKGASKNNGGSFTNDNSSGALFRVLHTDGLSKLLIAKSGEKIEVDSRMLCQDISRLGYTQRQAQHHAKVTHPTSASKYS